MNNLYDLTILSIMRDSAEYLPRYIAQVNDAFDRFGGKCHLVITEGDSIDGTKARLARLAEPDNDEVHGDVTVVELDLKNAKMAGNPDHPNRWHALECAWNTNLQHAEPTRYAACVESDLIWSADVLFKMIDELDAGCGDVVAPLLMRDTHVSGKYFYDVNAFKSSGRKFQNLPPYHPDWSNSQRFMPMDTVGGMIAMRGDTLKSAVWRNNCVLHFSEGTRVVCDTQTEILHP